MIFKLISLLFLSLFVIGVLIKMVISKTSTSCFMDSPFECGISANDSTRKSYSLPFFFVTIIFLLFDLEIIFIIPVAFFMNNFLIFLVFEVVLFIILIGLFLELIYGSLMWLNL